jgi:hypothetical protein
MEVRQVQRLRTENELEMLEKEKENQCGWHRVSEEEKSK